MRFKKTFTVRLRFPAGGTRAAADRPAGAASQAQGLFRPAADRYRRRLRTSILAAIAGALLVFLAIVLPDSLLPWLAIPGTLSVFSSLILFFTLPALVCPGCGKATDAGFGQFCPLCGSAALQRLRVNSAHCDACGRSMGRYKYRNYRIRFCTHCGSFLDPRGVV